MSSTLLQITAVRQMTADEIKGDLAKTPDDIAQHVLGNMATKALLTELKLLQPSPVETVFEEWEQTEVPFRLDWAETGADGREPEELTVLALYPSGAARTVPCDFQFTDAGVTFTLDGMSLLALCDPDNEESGPEADGVIPPFTETAVIVGIWV